MCLVLKVSRSCYYRDWEGESVEENRVWRLMCEMELVAHDKRKFRQTADSNHDMPMAQNHLDRQFNVSRPNETWVTDNTYIPTRDRWLYLCVFVDLFIWIPYSEDSKSRNLIYRRRPNRSFS
jgi:transposase InsO family protein